MMKTLSLLAVLPVIGALSMSTGHAASTCSTSNFGISAVPCGKRYAVSYEACRKYVIEHGASAAESWWYCTSQGYTK
ncbi:MULTISPECIES: hypothetical protein [Bradyrhizobium]|nr:MULTISPECIES: hypothetical protein [Bradyrhizobium]